MSEDLTSNRYEPIAFSSESTVVAECVRPDEVREERYQSEAELERDFIGRLQAQAYEYLRITSEADLIANLRRQLEALNRITFSDAEWKAFFGEKIAGAGDGIVEKTVPDVRDKQVLSIDTERALLAPERIAQIVGYILRALRPENQARQPPQSRWQAADRVQFAVRLRFDRRSQALLCGIRCRELDIVIVVNMFLTGFDATTLNTLWVDKNLRAHGLIQAYSRTNRILNSVKTLWQHRFLPRFGTGNQ